MNLSNLLQSSHGFLSKATPCSAEKLKSVEIGKWIGGKPQGTIKFLENEITIKLGTKILSRVALSTFPSKTQAEIVSKKLLFDECKKKGSLLNEYRYCTGPSGIYLEVKVGKLLVKCDPQSKDVIENFEWLYNMRHHFVFRKSGKKAIRLEEEILNISLKQKKVEMIDGDLLNYRLANLKVVSLKKN